MQSEADISEITQQHESEMQDIRREILSLSEKYSAKCLESADLESKIDHLNKQLSHANRNVTELELRNATLKTELKERMDLLKVNPKMKQ